MARSEVTGSDVATVAGRWFARLKRRPKQLRFNLSRRDLRALLGSVLTQASDRKSSR